MNATSSSVRFFIASTPEGLASALSDYNNTATVEAEFGDVCVEGTVLTLAHHGERGHNMPPCMMPNGAGNDVEIQAIGISHLDLDALGGVMAVLGVKPSGFDEFWNLAAFVDLNGPHMIGNSGASESDVEYLHAWWAWSEKNRMFAPRDGSAVDVTSQVLEAIDILDRILGRNYWLIDEGRAWKLTNESIERDSYRDEDCFIMLRESEKFVNHMYSHEGVCSLGVVAYNPQKGTITLSLARPLAGVSCSAIAKSLWGETAGGHAGIAGSPREGGLPSSEARRAFNALSDRIAALQAHDTLANEANHICGLL